MKEHQRNTSVRRKFCFLSISLAIAFLCLKTRTLAAERQTTSPNLAPTPAKVYRLHSGDTISVFYRLTPEYNQTLAILPDGSVNLRLIGTVQVAGLDVEQARQAIAAEANKRLRDPQISLSVTEFVRDQVTVMGEVGRPGRYEIHGSTSVVDALAQASGFTITSAQRKVMLVRPLGPNSEYGSATIFDFKQLIHNKSSVPVPEVQNGDIIIVTTSKFAKVSAIVKLGNVGLYYSPLPAF